MFQNNQIGILLLIVHIISSLFVGIIFRFWKRNKIEKIEYYVSEDLLSKNENITFSNLGEILGKSIISSIETILLIGGFIVLFSVILSILQNSIILDVLSKIIFEVLKIFGVGDIVFVKNILIGLVEMTNGLYNISNISYKAISINIIISSFLLGFGGLSILLQVNSIISKENISIKPYIIGKLMHGCIAAFLTYIVINCFPVFNFNL